MITKACLGRLSSKVNALLICVSSLGFILSCPGLVPAQSLEILNSRVLSGGTLTGRFKLSTAPGQDVIVEVSSKDPDVATVKPNKVTIRKDALVSEDFTIQAQVLQIGSQNPQDGKPVAIEAKFNNQTYSAQITVYPMLVIPTSMQAGDKITGTVNLLEPAPANGAKIQLIKDSPELTVLDTITVREGLTQKNFDVTANTIGSNSEARITAVYVHNSETKGNQFVDLAVKRNDNLLLLSIAVGVFTNFLAFVLIPWIFGARKVISNLILGEDGLPSTSKAQNLLWTIFVLLAYASIATVKLGMGHSVNISIKRNIIIVLGVSFAVRILVDMITTNQIQDDKKYKRSPDQTKEYLKQEKIGRLRLMSFLFTDDNGRVDLNKIQIMAWTFIALFIFTTEWFRNLLHANVEAMQLPEIDDALVVLMGLASGVYVGGKLVPSFPAISHLDPNHGKKDQVFKIFGAAFGDTEGQLLVKDAAGNTVTGWKVEKWANTNVDARVGSSEIGTYKIALIANGHVTENTKDFKVE